MKDSVEVESGVWCPAPNLILAVYIPTEINITYAKIFNKSNHDVSLH